MWKRWAVCPMRCGTKTAECFLWSGLCGRDFGPRDTDALRMIGALLCQSAAGEGRVGRHRRDDAALRMGRLRAASAATEERDFQNCISPGGVCGAVRASRMIYFPKIPACELACPICGPKTAEHAYCGPPPAEASARAALRRRSVADGCRNVSAKYYFQFSGFLRRRTERIFNS